MAVFGAPSTHEDDPERAVRCGLAMLEAAQELALDVRIGINTGEAVVAADQHRSEGVVGDEASGVPLLVVATARPSWPTGA